MTTAWRRPKVTDLPWWAWALLGLLTFLVLLPPILFVFDRWWRFWIIRSLMPPAGALS
mgnify:CR=1 FL=1